MEKPRLKKFHRELSRVTSKAAETLAEPFRMIYFLPLYDIKKNRQTRTTAGNISLMSEAGIYLVFPKDGILLSHLTMLRTMVRQGVSPVVVSNLPLSDADRDLLTKEAYRVIERPNIGYDFGGYRDSILSIEYLMPKLNRLWVLNDSAWLMDETGHWFVQARDLKVDFAGSVSNYGIKTVDIKNHDKIEWKYNEGNKDFHYTSNSWCIGSRVLSHPDFIRFWRRLQIRNSKKFTVNRGEIGFSQWVIRKGFTHDATLKLRDLRKNLESLSEIELDDVTRHLLMSRKSLENIKLKC